ASAPAPARRAVTVDVASFKFAPATVTVAAGGRVTWVNHDTAPHTAQNTGLKGPRTFDTGTLRRGARRTIAFARAGRYRYYCVFHRFMEADVIVKQGA
ncbi:MAG: plastocyanin/azurin family copper-binding protein, partial [Actinomycetota bacterium]|nr:plastocyanin/azurin family copper-binding protein [Actinomycetota bacterium]